MIFSWMSYFAIVSYSCIFFAFVSLCRDFYKMIVCLLLSTTLSLIINFPRLRRHHSRLPLHLQMMAQVQTKRRLFRRLTVTTFSLTSFARISIKIKVEGQMLKRICPCLSAFLSFKKLKHLRWVQSNQEKMNKEVNTNNFQEYWVEFEELGEKP